MHLVATNSFPVSHSCMGKNEKRFHQYQFVFFKPLGYCFEEIIRFDVKGSFASRPVFHLIKTIDITKEFKEKLFISTGLFMD